MKKKLYFLISIAFLLNIHIVFSQKAPLITDNITDKVVIGLPGVTVQQLAQIKHEFANRSQVIAAKFVYADHNCLLLNLDMTGTDFHQFYDVLKIISPYYDTSKAYIKPYPVFDEIAANLKAYSVTILK